VGRDIEQMDTTWKNVCLKTVDGEIWKNALHDVQNNGRTKA